MAQFDEEDDENKFNALLRALGSNSQQVEFEQPEEIIATRPSSPMESSPQGVEDIMNIEDNDETVPDMSLDPSNEENQLLMSAINARPQTPMPKLNLGASPTATLSPTVASSPDMARYKSLLEQYNNIPTESNLKDLQDQRREGLLLAGLLGAGNKIAQGVAHGSGARIDAASEIPKQIENLAGQGVTDYRERQKALLDELSGLKTKTQLGTELEKADYKSDISKFVRQQAYSYLGKIDPENKMQLQGQLENMSAAQLEKIPGLKSASGSSNWVGYGQFINAKGEPLALDQASKKLMNTVSGKEHKSEDQVFRPIAYNDAFGNRIYTSPSGNVMVSSSKREELPTDEKKSKQVEETFNPDKEQREVLNKEKERIDTLGKNINDKISASNKIIQALDGDSKLAMSVIKTQMPRLAGEVGNLNQMEQEAWQGSQAWLDQLEQKIKTVGTSQLTATNKAEIKKILAPFLKDAVSARENILTSSADGLQMMYKIPSGYTKKMYGQLRKLSPEQENMLSDKIVTVKGPSGETAQMKESVFKTKYKSKKGYQVIN